MIETFKNAWKIDDLRKKMLYTLMIILIFRIGSAIPAPFLDPTKLGAMIAEQSANGGLFGFIDVLSGGAFSRSTLFALNISPYITASIVVQLMGVVIPYLENLAKEGAEGRRQLNRITRYTAVGLAVLEGYGYMQLLKHAGALKYTTGGAGIFAQFVVVSCFVGGAMFVIWLGERIDEKGIGNGISMLLFAGIVSRFPTVIATMFNYLKLATKGGQYSIYFITVPVIAILFVVVIGFIILMTEAERRIPIMYAKRVVGRKMYGGQSTYIPIKVNMSGVMPVIFASSLLAIPGMIAGFVSPKPGGFWDGFLRLFRYNSFTYAVVYLLLILAFNYFYISIQYNPIEIANGLKANSGTIPGIRPGRPTSEFIARIVSKITFMGGIFLGIIAILPIMVSSITKINVALGGTTVIILVGVALDTVRQLESKMMMRHYKGFLE